MTKKEKNQEETKEEGKTKKGKKGKTKKETVETPTLIVASKVKDFIKGDGMRSGEDFMTGFNASTFKALKRAIKRCRDNGKATLRPFDVD